MTSEEHNTIQNSYDDNNEYKKDNNKENDHNNVKDDWMHGNDHYKDTNVTRMRIMTTKGL